MLHSLTSSQRKEFALPLWSKINKSQDNGLLQQVMTLPSLLLSIAFEGRPRMCHRMESDLNPVPSIWNSRENKEGRKKIDNLTNLQPTSAEHN